MSKSGRLQSFDDQEPTEEELRESDGFLEEVKKSESGRLTLVSKDPFGVELEKIHDCVARILLLIQHNGEEEQLTVDDILNRDISTLLESDREEVVQLRAQIIQSEQPFVRDALKELLSSQAPLFLSQNNESLY